MDRWIDHLLSFFSFSVLVRKASTRSRTGSLGPSCGGGPCPCPSPCPSPCFCPMVPGGWRYETGGWLGREWEGNCLGLGLAVGCLFGG